MSYGDLETIHGGREPRVRGTDRDIPKILQGTV